MSPWVALTTSYNLLANNLQLHNGSAKPLKGQHKPPAPTLSLAQEIKILAANTPRIELHTT
jgi:hypothetical protein